MVCNGWAVAYRRYGRQYVDEKNAASHALAQERVEFARLEAEPAEADP